MRLSEFIRDTLFEIALGVQHGKMKARDLIAINPGSLNGDRLTEKSYIDFDVSVVVNEKKITGGQASGKLGGEIRVASIARVSAELGGSRSRADKSATEQAHRVAFKVPVYMNAHFRGDPLIAEEAAVLAEIATDPNKIELGHAPNH